MDKTTTSENRLSFSQINPKLQLAWDSTSLGALKRCPRYYEYNIIEGYVSRLESIHLRFGTEYNNALATYHIALAQGKTYEDAVLLTVRYAMTQTWDETLGRPWTSDLPMKTRETLLRSIIWYLDKFEDDPCETVVLATGEAAVELPFRIHLDILSSLTEEPYLLCGYLDSVVKFCGGEWITDKKTTRYALDEKYFAQYTPHNQVSQYSFAGDIAFHSLIRGVIIDAVQLGVTYSRFQRQQISRTKPQLEEWLSDTVIVIRQNEVYVNENHWPMNDTACDMYGGCPYRTVCAASPEIRPKLLENLFQKRSWDPLVVREI